MNRGGPPRGIVDPKNANSDIPDNLSYKWDHWKCQKSPMRPKFMVANITQNMEGTFPVGLWSHPYPTGLFLYLRPCCRSKIKSPKKLLGFAQDLRSENCLVPATNIPLVSSFNCLLPGDRTNRNKLYTV